MSLSLTYVAGQMLSFFSPLLIIWCKDKTWHLISSVLNYGSLTSQMFGKPALNRTPFYMGLYNETLICIIRTKLRFRLKIAFGLIARPSQLGDMELAL